MEFLAQAGRILRFSGELILSLRAIPSQVQNISLQAYKTLLGNLPLAIVSGIATGMVVWLHLRGLLVSVAGPSAVTFLPQALTLAVVVELAPLTAALILAGRSGANLAAELASMKQTEQIDALQVLGVDISKHLVLPRILACAMVLPMLTLFTAYLSLLSGFLTECLTGSMHWNQYIQQVLKVLAYRDAVPALAKTVFFGAGIGILACYHGLNASEGTEGVGKAATRGVVSSIFFVLVSNVFLVKLIHLFLD